MKTIPKIEIIYLRQLSYLPFLLSIFVILTLILNPCDLNGQGTDTIPVTKVEESGEKEKKPHSIRRATIFSSVLPGLGQAYNKKYWKIPIIYAGFGVMTYFIIYNTSEFKEYEEAYVYTANGETYPIDNDYVGRYTLDQLQSGMDTYRKYRDLSYIITGLWYVFNILDAHVDAHFIDYDISDDLTLMWQPYFKPWQARPYSQKIPETGLKFTLTF